MACECSLGEVNKEMSFNTAGETQSSQATAVVENCIRICLGLSSNPASCVRTRDHNVATREGGGLPDAAFDHLQFYFWQNCDGERFIDFRSG